MMSNGCVYSRGLKMVAHVHKSRSYDEDEDDDVMAAEETPVKTHMHRFFQHTVQQPMIVLAPAQINKPIAFTQTHTQI